MARTSKSLRLLSFLSGVSFFHRSFSYNRITCYFSCHPAKTDYLEISMIGTQQKLSACHDDQINDN